MLTKTLQLGELRFSNQLILKLVSNVVVEIPGVLKLENPHYADHIGTVSKNLSKFKTKSSITRDAISIEWLDDKEAWELKLHIIVSNVYNIHSIMTSIYDRIKFEFQDKLQISNINLKIYIEDIREDSN